MRRELKEVIEHLFAQGNFEAEMFPMRRELKETAIDTQTTPDLDEAEMFPMRRELKGSLEIRFGGSKRAEAEMFPMRRELKVRTAERSPISCAGKQRCSR